TATGVPGAHARRGARDPRSGLGALAGDETLNVNTGWTIVVRRDPAGPPRQAGASVAFISPGYFKTMGIALVRGRDFEDRDQTGPLGPIIVNEHFVNGDLAA